MTDELTVATSGSTADVRTRPTVVLALACAVLFMVVLDLAVVNVALPTMQADLGLDPSELQWVVVAYGIVFGGFLLLGGRSGDLLGHRRVLVVGLTTFTFASAVAGWAPSFGPLVTARAVQGFGAALAAPCALALLTTAFPEGPTRNRALGIFGAAGGTAAATGAVVSGILTDGPGWRWIFLVNIPMGIALVVMVVLHAPRDRRRRRAGRPDVTGAITLTVGVMAIVAAVNRSVIAGWSSPTTVGLIVIGTLSLVMFVLVERLADAPLVPPSLFRRRTLTAANVVSALVAASFFGVVFQTTLFMQQVLGYSALRTGIAYLAVAIVSLVIAAVIAPGVVDRFGVGVVLAAGQGLCGFGMLMLARTPADGSYATDLLPAFVVIGVGLGLSETTAHVAAFIGVEPAIAGLAGGLVETSREVGAAVGTAVISSIALGRAATFDAASGSSGRGSAAASAAGFQLAVVVAALLTVVSALVALLVLRPAERQALTPHPDERPSRTVS